MNGDEACPVCGSPMQDLREIKLDWPTPLPTMPDWRCMVAPDGSHAEPGVFPAWWLEAINAPSG